MSEEKKLSTTNITGISLTRKIEKAINKYPNSVYIPDSIHNIKELNYYQKRLLGISFKWTRKYNKEKKCYLSTGIKFYPSDDLIGIWEGYSKTYANQIVQKLDKLKLIYKYTTGNTPVLNKGSTVGYKNKRTIYPSQLTYWFYQYENAWVLLKDYSLENFNKKVQDYFRERLIRCTDGNIYKHISLNMMLKFLKECDMLEDFNLFNKIINKEIITENDINNIFDKEENNENDPEIPEDFADDINETPAEDVEYYSQYSRVDEL